MIFKYADGKILSNIAAKMNPVKDAVRQYNAMLNVAGKRTNLLEQQISKLAGTGTKLESYFKSLGETGQASVVGYIGYLIKAQGKTLALKAATLALNAAIQFGLSMLASLAINKIVELANAAKEAREAAADAAGDTQEM